MCLLVTHLTRMTHPRICVAGLDLETAAHVRPVRTAADPLTLSDTREHSGIFVLGGVVDLGPMTSCGSPPETEDHRYDPRRAEFARMASEDELWSMLRVVARNDLHQIFGPELRAVGGTYAVDVGAGSASLGCLRARQPLHLYVGSAAGRPRLRLALHLAGHDRDLAVTDLRLFTADFSAPDGEVVQELNEKLKGAEEILLSVGLSRPFPRTGETQPRHWLQVNTIFCR